jgi:hypothetical protein|tara:strand:- start:1910 stop:2110 length:201 start_codon:yes stop_codon:yes gene_type:complete
MKDTNRKIQLYLIIIMSILYVGLIIKIALDDPAEFLRVGVPILGGGAASALTIYGVLMLLLPKNKK